ncbi:MAG: DinB family protein [Candidatus Thorarchaeota archaeon]
MREVIIDIIEKGFYGSFTHRGTFDILDGITHEQAQLKAADGLFSSWELLYHIVYWQGLILEAVNADAMDWKKAMDEHWPSKDEEKENTWDVLVGRFKEGIEDATALLKKSELTAPMKPLRDEPKLRAFVILAQHNSYHLGQIVVNRKANDLWPYED